MKNREYVKQPDDHPQVRDLYVSKEEVHTHGPSPNCQRCRSIIRGKDSTKPHTAECRERFRELLKSTESGRRKVRKAEERLVAETYRRSSVMEQDDESKKKRAREEQEAAQSKQDTPMPPDHSATAASSNAATDGSTVIPESVRGKKRVQVGFEDDADEQAHLYRKLEDEPDAEHRDIECSANDWQWRSILVGSAHELVTREHTHQSRK